MKAGTPRETDRLIAEERRSVSEPKIAAAHQEEFRRIALGFTGNMPEWILGIPTETEACVAQSP
jgi:hypothetical protein